MPHFMSYQLVILNGEKHGERLTIGRSPVTIGRGSSCDICLPDSEIGELHAKITPRAEQLQICVMGETNRLLINKSEVHESPLKHGDVIEIGHTRLFVQSYLNTGTWEGLAGFRKWRKLLTIGLPLLVLATILLIGNCSFFKITPPPTPAARLSRPYTNNDTNNTDWMVTNIPTILINPTVILTSSPPEIVEAEDMLIQSRTNNIEQEIKLAQSEMEFATRFLDAARAQNPKESTVPDNFTNMGASETSTNQADNLKN